MDRVVLAAGTSGRSDVELWRMPVLMLHPCGRMGATRQLTRGAYGEELCGSTWWPLGEDEKTSVLLWCKSPLHDLHSMTPHLDVVMTIHIIAVMAFSPVVSILCSRFQERMGWRVTAKIPNWNICLCSFKLKPKLKVSSKEKKQHSLWVDGLNELLVIIVRYREITTA